MRSYFGNNLKIEVSGESHSESVSAKITGLPAGYKIDGEKLQAFMKRRQGGNLPFTTPRKEEDLPEFVTGVDENGATTGEPLTAVIYNKNVRSGDYAGFADTPRPSHAEYTAQMRFGKDIDLRGGGHFSARLTAPLCAVGGILKQMLESKGIYIGTHLYSVGGVLDTPYSLTDVDRNALDASLKGCSLPVISDEAAEKMTAELAAAAKESDSLGGVVECAVIGMPAGYGDPLYDGVENCLAGAMFGLGGVRGIEFGTGFAASSMRGSQHNDPFCIKDGKIVTETNHHGGVIGGITSGMPIVFRVAFKPTASIGIEQRTVSLSEMKETVIKIGGRHDPCIAIRALPCVEALTAIVLADLMLAKDHTFFEKKVGKETSAISGLL